MEITFREFVKINYDVDLPEWTEGYIRNILRTERINLMPKRRMDMNLIRKYFIHFETYLTEVTKHEKREITDSE